MRRDLLRLFSGCFDLPAYIRQAFFSRFRIFRKYFIEILQPAASLFFGPDQLRKLRREYGALIQLNAKTVIRKHHFFRERYIRRILEEGLVDFISSDSHDMPGRSNHMLEAYEQLAEDLGEARARKLTYGNADRFLRESRQYQAEKDEGSAD